MDEGLIDPMFVGDKKVIKKLTNEIKWDISNYEIIDEPIENNTAPIAAKIASEGKVKIIVKGHIHTDILMTPVFHHTKLFMGRSPSSLFYLCGFTYHGLWYW